MSGAPVDTMVLEAQIIEAIRTCFDPEIPVNIYDLGLIYEVKVDPMGAAEVRLTLTSPNCPSAASLPEEVRMKVEEIPGVTSVMVDVVFDPPWDPSRMSEVAKLQLGMF